MSVIVFILLVLAIWGFYNDLTKGSTNVNRRPHNQADKDIERLREIADYDRWEDKGNRRKNK